MAWDKIGVSGKGDGNSLRIISTKCYTIKFMKVYILHLFDFDQTFIEKRNANEANVYLNLLYFMVKSLREHFKPQNQQQHVRTQLIYPNC